MASAYELNNLIKWLARKGWKPLLEEVMTEHFGPAMAAFDLEFEEIGAALGGNWEMTLWGCAFEDFLTRRFEPDGRNVVEAYLRQHGGNEPVASRQYMTALQTSIMSLYEVSDIRPGQSFRARDLLRATDPVLVSERTATRTLKTWDRIAARIVPQGEQLVLAGGLLAFTLKGSETLITNLQDQVASAGGQRRSRRRAAAARAISDEDLRRSAPLFTTTWLLDVLPKALGLDRPRLLNSDGDEIVFHTVTFPLAPATSEEEVAGRLEQLPQLRRENETFWNWLGEPASARPRGRTKKALAWNISLEDGTPVLGNIELHDWMLALTVNSAARAEAGRALLTTALGDLVAAPLTTIQTVEQMMASRGDDGPPAAEVPAEIQTRVVHTMLDEQYRALLDEPVGMLGDISPRAAARTARGRKQLVVWLKHLENRSRHTGERNDPLATYDFTWMWRELKIEHLRS
jgi:hypothetical protein